MESNSLRSSPQEGRRIVYNKPITAIQEMKPQRKASSYKHKNTKGGGEKEEEEEEDNGFSWPPPRAYSCGFCKRQFRSAQALGGHMNVHRRDRAKLRRSPPMDSNGSSSEQQQPIKFLKLSDFSSFNGVEEESDGGCKIWNKVRKFVRMEKEISLVGSSNDIDLELRLGF